MSRYVFTLKMIIKLDAGPKHVTKHFHAIGVAGHSSINHVNDLLVVGEPGHRFIRPRMAESINSKKNWDNFQDIYVSSELNVNCYVDPVKMEGIAFKNVSW